MTPRRRYDDRRVRWLPIVLALLLAGLIGWLDLDSAEVTAAIVAERSTTRF